MAFEKGFYIDGKLKGNESRFINHSCDPNCKVERWNVQGRKRIGIFAIKDVWAGDFLSYGYRLETPEESIFGCECSSINCRGTLAISTPSPEEFNPEHDSIIEEIDRRERKNKNN